MQAHRAKRTQSRGQAVDHPWATEPTGLSGPTGPSQWQSWKLEEWCDAVRAASRSEARVFTIIHLFAGERREDDIEECPMKRAATDGLTLLVLSVDLANDPEWDLTSPSTFDKLRELVVEGLIDAVLGGPPCSTWSRLRFRPGGPRPLRFRKLPGAASTFRRPKRQDWWRPTC